MDMMLFIWKRSSCGVDEHSGFCLEELKILMRNESDD